MAGNGASVTVLLVDPSQAKTTKSALGEALDKDYRLTEAGDKIAVPVRWYPEELECLPRDECWCRFSSSKLAKPADRIRKTVEEACRAVCPAVDMERVRSWKSCPKSFDIFGDDRTLMLPERAFLDDEFLAVVERCGDQLWLELWKRLAELHRSPRVVRKGTIDPESGIRRSGCTILYPQPPDSEATGPDSPGWITVTEHGVRQSFDLTRAMFSRGNAPEKKRFQSLVQSSDRVLDLYAGIGYFSLQALAKGATVVACEWNPDAVLALRYNLQDNGFEATVYEGDCREICRREKLENQFDRVSLGLLPSSEGGWKAAVAALKEDAGGWLHVHGNVPEIEVDAWTLWLCQRLLSMVINPQHAVVCTHVEKVKTFAPTINHYVADVWIGTPRDGVPAGRAGLVRNDVQLTPLETLTPPSCALSENGVLHQEWMR